jgi:hypothetical protein
VSFWNSEVLGPGLDLRGSLLSGGSLGGNRVFSRHAQVPPGHTGAMPASSLPQVCEYKVAWVWTACRLGFHAHNCDIVVPMLQQTSWNPDGTGSWKETHRRNVAKILIGGYCWMEIVRWPLANHGWLGLRPNDVGFSGPMCTWGWGGRDRWIWRTIPCSLTQANITISKVMRVESKNWFFKRSKWKASICSDWE